MTSTTDPERNDRWAGLTRAAPWIGAVVLAGGAVVMAVRVGVPAAVLWFGFAALAGAVLLFWEALRSVVDPEATASEAHQAALAGEMADLEARKRGAVKALKDLEFEHSIGRMSDEDYNALREKYRTEARAAMEAIDRGLGAYLDEAKKLVAEAAKITPVESSDAAVDDADSNGTAAPALKPSATDAPAATSAAVADETSTAKDTAADASVKAAPTSDASTASTESKAAMPAVSTTATADTSSRTCPSCGTRNDADATFCKRCAARLEEAAS